MNWNKTEDTKPVKGKSCLCCNSKRQVFLASYQPRNVGSIITNRSIPPYGFVDNQGNVKQVSYWVYITDILPLD